MTVAISRQASIIYGGVHRCRIMFNNFRMIDSFGGEIIFIGIMRRGVCPLNLFVSLHLRCMLNW